MAGLDQGGNHQAVPVGQDFIVLKGAGAAVPEAEKFLPQGLKELLLLWIEAARIMQAVKNGFALPISSFFNTVIFIEGVAMLSQDSFNLGFGPDVELAFLALAVGIKRRTETAARGGHFAEQPANGFTHPGFKKRLFGFLPGFAKHIYKQGAIIKHFFKMGRQPIAISGVAAQSTAQVIINPALANLAKRLGYSLFIIFSAGADAGPPQKIEPRHLRKLRGLISGFPVRVCMGIYQLRGVPICRFGYVFSRAGF